MKKELKTLKEMRADIDANIEKLSKPKFKKGDWVKLTDSYSRLEKDSVYQIVMSQSPDNYYYYIVDHKAFGIEDANYLAPYATILTMATPTEVQQALEKEAVKRYGELKVGDKVKGHWGDEIKTMKDERDYYLSIDSQHIYFGINNVCLMCDGKWAEIIRTLTIDEIASKLIGLDFEDTKSELIRMKTQIIETLKTISMIYGTLNESDSISPSDDKEKRYTECEYCCGDGWILLEQDENEGKQVRVDCHICHGEGQIEIEY